MLVKFKFILKVELMQFADGMDVMYQGRKESRVISKLLD